MNQIQLDRRKSWFFGIFVPICIIFVIVGQFEGIPTNLISWIFVIIYAIFVGIHYKFIYLEEYQMKALESAS